MKRCECSPFLQDPRILWYSGTSISQTTALFDQSDYKMFLCSPGLLACVKNGRLKKEVGTERPYAWIQATALLIPNDFQPFLLAPALTDFSQSKKKSIYPIWQASAWKFAKIVAKPYACWHSHACVSPCLLSQGVWFDIRCGFLYYYPFVCVIISPWKKRLVKEQRSVMPTFGEDRN